MKSIYVKFQKTGFHRWPEAPDKVDFLRSEHRHLFFFRVQIQVEHKDRELEFFIFKDEVECLTNSIMNKLKNSFSCEMLADEMLQYLIKKYPNRKIEIEVSEDNENGAIVNNQ